MSSELSFLRERLEEATAGLSGVTFKRMFGCEACFRDGTMFGLVWKDGRIGLKLPDPASHAKLSAIAGVEPWSPRGKGVMGAWLLVPPAWNEDDDALKPWARIAHAQATGEGKKKAATKKAPAKKAATKKAPAKKKKSPTR
jgi:TfoX/Sxy family transcriptional regulator of competence genes